MSGHAGHHWNISWMVYDDDDQLHLSGHLLDAVCFMFSHNFIDHLSLPLANIMTGRRAHVFLGKMSLKGTEYEYNPGHTKYADGFY